tara:strand:+ start:1364 stop:2053 length:690 start_codon:yes stop_codon:yes gene_type:complete
MQIRTALILCAGFGKRLNPLTEKIPKPLLEINNVTLLENCINLVIKLGIKKIFLNTFHLSDQIISFIKKKNFQIKIQIIEDGKEILDTGGGIFNMMKESSDKDFIIFNPDTLWNNTYHEEISKMQNFYFSNKLNNVLLLANKTLSFDKNLSGDFNLKDDLIYRGDVTNFIYIGCQILNKNLFNKYDIKSFSVTEIWNDLLKTNELNGFESVNKFYHLTNLETFRKLEDL